MPSIEDERRPNQARPALRQAENEVILLSPQGTEQASYSRRPLETETVLRNLASQDAPFSSRGGNTQEEPPLPRSDLWTALTARRPMPSAGSVRPLDDNDYARALAPLPSQPCQKRPSGPVAHDETTSSWGPRRYATKEIRFDATYPDTTHHYSPRKPEELVPVSYATLPLNNTYSTQRSDLHVRPARGMEEAHDSPPRKVILVKGSRDYLPGPGQAGNDQFFTRAAPSAYFPSDRGTTVSSARLPEGYDTIVRTEKLYRHVPSQAPAGHPYMEGRNLIVQPQYRPVEGLPQDQYLQERHNPRHVHGNFLHSSSHTGRAREEVASASNGELDRNQRRLPGRNPGTEIIIIE